MKVKLAVESQRRRASDGSDVSYQNVLNRAGFVAAVAAPQMADGDASASVQAGDLASNSVGDCWCNAQSVLHEITDQLQHGQMFHAEHFSLFEAMSAVEIGDPKMDAGLDTAAAPTPDELIDRGLAPLNLSTSQLVACLDHLAAMQASWHSGNSIAQTVFVCLYMLKPDRYTDLADPVGAYCYTGKGTVYVIIDMILPAL